MPNDILKELFKEYNYIHPLIVKRTLENTKSKEKSIYILNNLPKYPIFWNSTQEKWINKNASIN